MNSTKILVINGVNLNMLGMRETEIYGRKNLAELERVCVEHGKELGYEVECFQSNYEGELVARIQTAKGIFGGIVINAGAYTHTSIAILDALRGAALPTVEVHLTDLNAREKFRQFSYVSLYAEKVVMGKGFNGYREAIEFIADKFKANANAKA